MPSRRAAATSPSLICADHTWKKSTSLTEPRSKPLLWFELADRWKTVASILWSTWAACLCKNLRMPLSVWLLFFEEWEVFLSQCCYRFCHFWRIILEFYDFAESFYYLICFREIISESSFFWKDGPSWEFGPFEEKTPYLILPLRNLKFKNFPS